MSDEKQWMMIRMKIWISTIIRWAPTPWFTFGDTHFRPKATTKPRQWHTLIADTGRCWCSRRQKAFPGSWVYLWWALPDYSIEWVGRRSERCSTEFSGFDELLKIPHEPRTGRTEFRNRKKFSLVRLSSTHKMQFRDHIANWLILNECTPRESKTGPIRSPFGGCFRFARVASSVSLWPLPEHIRTAWTVRKHHTDSDYNWLLLASSGLSPAHTD